MVASPAFEAVTMPLRPAANSKYPLPSVLVTLYFVRAVVPVLHAGVPYRSASGRQTARRVRDETRHLARALVPGRCSGDQEQRGGYGGCNDSLGHGSISLLS